MAGIAYGLAVVKKQLITRTFPIGQGPLVASSAGCALSSSTKTG